MLSNAYAVAKLRELVFKLNYVNTKNISDGKTSTRETQYYFGKHD